MQLETQFSITSAKACARPARILTSTGRKNSLKTMATQSEVMVTGVGFIRPHLRKLKAYTPIEPFEVLSKKLGKSPKDIVKLDANENPYGPPPEVLEALGNMQFPNIYPDPETRALRKALADWQDVPMEHLLVRSLLRNHCGYSQMAHFSLNKF
jgi:histidinol-phosphate aminotransferase